MSEEKKEQVEHPSHYNALTKKVGVECIEVVENFNFNTGNAMKYLWRAGLKSPDAVTDMKKALWYVQREIERLEKEQSQQEEASAEQLVPQLDLAVKHEIERVVLMVYKPGTVIAARHTHYLLKHAIEVHEIRNLLINGGSIARINGEDRFGLTDKGRKRLEQLESYSADQAREKI